LSRRRTYAVERDDLTRVTRDEADAVAAAFLDVLHPVLRVAAIDAYSDFRDDLPPAVEESQEWLRQRGGRRGRGDSGMDVRIPVEDEQGWAMVRVYAAWSIDAEFFGEPDELLLWLHDGGVSVTADLTDEEAETLTVRLAGIASIRPLPERRRRRCWGRRR
jgi:hypothetical protein